MANTVRHVSKRMMDAAPLLPVAAGLIAGIVFDRRVESPRSLYVGLFLLAAITVLIPLARNRFGPLAVLLAATCAGALLHAATDRTIPQRSIERYVSDAGPIARVRGIVASQPLVIDSADHPFKPWLYAPSRTAFLLEVESIEGRSAPISIAGLLTVTIHDAVLDLQENQAIELFGRLYPLQPPRNPGAVDWAAFHRRQGVVAALHVDQRENILRLDTAGAGPWRRAAAWLRTTGRNMLTSDLPGATGEEASLLAAMVLGHRSQFDRRLNEVFIRAGCIHFIAVSGTNVAVLMSFVWVVGRLLRLTRRRCAWLMIGAILTYAVVAEARPPILRATVIGILFCISLLVRRPHTGLNWLAAAAILLILIDPTTVFDLGFQLSFAAVLGVMYLPSALHDAAISLRATFDRVIRRWPRAAEDRRLAALARDPRRRPSAVRRGLQYLGWYAWWLVAASVGAWLVGAPIILTAFQRMQPWGIVSSVVMFPLMSFVMVLGVIKIAIAAVSHSMSSLIAWPLTWLDAGAIRVAEVFASLPGASMSMPPPPWWWTAAYYLALLVFISAFYHGRDDAEPTRRETEPRPRWLPTATALALLALGASFWLWPKRASDRLIVTVLAVGHGSATVIELPDGQTILYDAGSLRPSDIGRNTVEPFLRQRGISRLEQVYVSHPNLDHFSGLPTLMDEVAVGSVLVNRFFEPNSPPNSPSRHFLNLLAGRGHCVDLLAAPGARTVVGGAEFEILWPPPDLPSTVDANDTSSVIRLSYAGHSILLTGDIEQYAQQALLKTADLHADVLVLPHHGGVRTTTAEFIREVGARVLIRSSGERMADTGSGLMNIVGDRRLFNTADLGAIEVAINTRGVQLSSFFPSTSASFCKFDP